MSAAELLADGGAAAVAPEFFRSAEFLAAEEASHSLRIETPEGEMLAPLIVREVPGGAREDATGGARQDAVSPYGYPGVAGAGGAVTDPGEIDWSGAGLVSLFLRHRIGIGPPLSGATRRNVVQIADPALARKSRPSDRQQIRRNAQRGYTTRRLAGPQATDSDREGFEVAYEQTMRRADAARRYFFGSAYFARILSFADSWLFLTLDSSGRVAAGSIVTRSDAMLHYYLSGTADDFLADSPMKNLVAAIVDFGEELGLPVNLGGGLQPGDALEEFKRGFANRTEPFYTSEIVCDHDAYRRLCAGREAGGYFPAYRAP